jgi:hypothetical protein
MNKKKKKQPKKFDASKKAAKLSKPKKSALTFVQKGDKKTLKLLDVVWKDHTISGKGDGWRDMNSVKVKFLPCYTVGYLIDEDSEAIALANTVSSEGDVGEIITILKDCIIKRKEL